MFEQRTGCWCRTDDRDLIPFLTRLEQIMLKKSTLGITIGLSRFQYSYSWNWFKLNLDLDASLDLVAFADTHKKDPFENAAKTKKPIERRAKERKNLVSFHSVAIFLPDCSYSVVFEFLNRLPVRVYSGKRTQITSILFAEYDYLGYHLNNVCMIGCKFLPNNKRFQNEFDLIYNAINGLVSMPTQQLKIWICYGGGIPELDKMIERLAIREAMKQDKKTCLDVPRISLPYWHEDKLATLIEVGLFIVGHPEKEGETYWSFFLSKDLYDPRLFNLITSFLKSEDENEDYTTFNLINKIRNFVRY